MPAHSLGTPISWAPDGRWLLVIHWAFCHRRSRIGEVERHRRSNDEEGRNEASQPPSRPSPRPPSLVKHWAVCHRRSRIGEVERYRRSHDEAGRNEAFWPPPRTPQDPDPWPVYGLYDQIRIGCRHKLFEQVREQWPDAFGSFTAVLRDSAWQKNGMSWSSFFSAMAPLKMLA